MKRIALFLTIALGACQSAPSPAPEPAPQEPKSPLMALFLREASSVQGRQIESQIFGEEGHVVLFLASIHGDESAGTKLVEELGRQLQSNPGLLGGYRAILVPVVNPDGLALGTRRNAHNVDLNRNFPARNFQGSRYRGLSSLSEPESTFIRDLIRIYKPARILSFHQAANRIDYDGAGASLAYRLAQDSPLQVRRMGQRPGSLGSWAGDDLQIPVLTIELPASAADLSAEEAWQTYGSILTGSLLP